MLVNSVHVEFSVLKAALLQPFGLLRFDLDLNWRKSIWCLPGPSHSPQNRTVWPEKQTQQQKSIRTSYVGMPRFLLSLFFLSLPRHFLVCLLPHYSVCRNKAGACRWIDTMGLSCSLCAAAYVTLFQSVL